MASFGGFTVGFEADPRLDRGTGATRKRRIVVDADQPADAWLRIPIHHHALGVGYADTTRERVDVIVNTSMFSRRQARSRKPRRV